MRKYILFVLLIYVSLFIKGQTFTSNVIDRVDHYGNHTKETVKTTIVVSSDSLFLYTNHKPNGIVMKYKILEINPYSGAIIAEHFKTKTKGKFTFHQKAIELRENAVFKSKIYFKLD